MSFFTNNWSVDSSSNKLKKTKFFGFVDVSGETPITVLSSENNSSHGSAIIRNGSLNLEMNNYLANTNITFGEETNSSGASVGSFNIPIQLNFYINDVEIGYIDETGTNFPAKNYIITHPLDGNKQLRHSNLETPELKNMYAGYSYLVDGHATINLDSHFGMTEGTFSAINKNAYVITSNESNFDPIVGNVNNNILTIRSKTTTNQGKVSWIVFAIRSDILVKKSPLLNAYGNYIAEF